MLRADDSQVSSASCDRDETTSSCKDSCCGGASDDLVASGEDNCIVEENDGCCAEDDEDCVDCCENVDRTGSRGTESRPPSLGLSDDAACDCCIRVLIGQPSQQLERTDESPPFNATTGYLEAYTGVLRACCKALEQYCIRRSCCFVPRLADQPKSSLPTPLPALKDIDVVMRSGQDKPGSDAISFAQHGENLRLGVRGMDCIDCVPKVRRALSQLPSVACTTVDYFSGVVELRYDPEIITPPAIASYVARGTGFGFRILTDSNNPNATALFTLPLTFATPPPLNAFDGLETRVGSDIRIIEVSYTVHPETGVRPRDILERFSSYGAELVPVGFGGHRDNATRDLIDVGCRTAACALLSVPVLVFAWAHLPRRPLLYSSISIGLTTLIQVLAFHIISSGIRSIIYLRQVDLSVLVTITTLSAYLFSVVTYAFEVAGKPFADPFFETNALLITFIMLGRTISAATRRSTGSTLRELQRLQPNEVLVVSDQKIPRTLDARLLHYGDVIRIDPDTRVATDGIVIAGSSDVDESSVTGESVAVPKQPGNPVIAGTLNLSGTLDVQVTHLVHENSLSRITTLVRNGQSLRLSAQDLADRLSRMILPAAIFTACTAFLAWVLIGRYVRHRSATSASIEALTYAIAILVVSCPCAIGLSVPAIVARAIRIGMREGILFRSADVLQTAYGVDTIVFDKTGTLTQGNMTTERAEFLVEGAEEIILSLVKDNKHPISQGVHQYLTARKSPSDLQTKSSISDVVFMPGKGIKASISGFPLLGGSPSFTGACTHPLSLELQSSGLSLFSVTLAGRPIAFFGLADTPRPHSNALITELTRRGKNVIILSGDTPSSVHRLANSIGVPVERALAAQTPDDKDAAIAALQAKGQRVCFVGDGTNDGPALSRADIAVVMAGGSDVALSAAGAVLTGPDIRRGVLGLLDIATAARVHCRLALSWCALYNCFAILLASGVLVKARIELRWAGIGEVVSVLPVVAIALLLDLRWAWRAWTSS